MVEEITWAVPIGILLFLETIFLLLYLYEKYKKVSYVLYTLGLNLYLFTIFYTWNIYEDNRNFVLIILLVSSFILFVLGKFIFKNRDKKKTDSKNKFKNLKYLLLIFSTLFIITFIVGIFSTSSYKINFVDTIKPNKSTESSSSNENNILIGKISLNNNFILPSSAIIKPFFACYNNKRIPLIIGNRYVSLNKNFIIDISPKNSKEINLSIPNYIFYINKGSSYLKELDNKKNFNDTFIFIYEIKNKVLEDDVFNCNIKNKVLLKKIEVK